MNVQKIGNISLIIGEAAVKKANSSAKTPIDGNVDSTQRFDALTDISPAAVTLQRSDQALTQMENSASKMKTQLMKVRRTLPPFEPGDAERVRILRGYFGLRQLIDELTIPPPAKPSWLKEGIDQPKLNAESADQEVEMAVTVQQKRASPGAGEI